MLLTNMVNLSLSFPNGNCKFIAWHVLPGSLNQKNCDDPSCHSHWQEEHLNLNRRSIKNWTCKGSCVIQKDILKHPGLSSPYSKKSHQSRGTICKYHIKTIKIELGTPPQLKQQQQQQQQKQKYKKMPISKSHLSYSLLRPMTSNKQHHMWDPDPDLGTSCWEAELHLCMPAHTSSRQLDPNCGWFSLIFLDPQALNHWKKVSKTYTQLPSSTPCFYHRSLRSTCRSPTCVGRLVIEEALRSRSGIFEDSCRGFIGGTMCQADTVHCLTHRWAVKTKLVVNFH